MNGDKPGDDVEVNRRSVLASIGGISGGITALAAASDPAKAIAAAAAADDVPDVETIRGAFATHGQPIIRELAERDILGSPTVEALGIRETAAYREGERVGHVSAFQIDGETYRGFDTLVSNGDAEAVVSVIPATGKAMASISPASGIGVILGTTSDDSVTVMHDGECEDSSNKYIEACGCEWGNSPCKCENNYTFYLQHWTCSCGEGCTHHWQECPDSSGMTCTCWDPNCNQNDCCCKSDCAWYE